VWPLQLQGASVHYQNCWTSCVLVYTRCVPQLVGGALGRPSVSSSTPLPWVWVCLSSPAEG
jgi:hypothetical protein